MQSQSGTDLSQNNSLVVRDSGRKPLSRIDSLVFSAESNKSQQIRETMLLDSKSDDVSFELQTIAKKLVHLESKVQSIDVSRGHFIITEKQNVNPVGQIKRNLRPREAVQMENNTKYHLSRPQSKTRRVNQSKRRYSQSNQSVNTSYKSTSRGRQSHKFNCTFNQTYKKESFARVQKMREEIVRLKNREKVQNKEILGVRAEMRKYKVLNTKHKDIIANQKLEIERLKNQLGARM